MKRIFLFLLMGFILLNSGYSQDTTHESKRISINISPTPLFDSYSRFRFGMDYKIGSKMAVGLDFGIGSSDFVSFNSTDAHGNFSKKHQKVFEIRPEIKLYLTNKKWSSWYLATEFFYINKERKYNDDYFYPEEPGIEIHYDSALFHSEKMGMHVKIGLELLAGKIVKFDIFGGLGIASRNNYYTQVAYREEEYFSEEKGLLLFNNYRYEGSKIIPHITLGFRIGFVVFDD